ncbi:MAG: thiol-disulfide oxidoreductase DCC family protein [Longimicrobiales bacterium]
MRPVPLAGDAARRADVESADRRDRYTVVYDGDCSVCARVVDRLKKMDVRGALAFEQYQTPGVRARFPWIPSTAFEEAMQFIAPDGTTWQGARAVEDILRILPRGRPFALLFRIPFARAIAARVYHSFARNRHKLGCGEHCSYRPPGSTPADDERQASS